MLFANHYNTQELRNYPLDDNVDGVGDDGTQLPFDVLVDCRLRMPATLGSFAFLGGVTVTANLVTLVILGSDAVDSVGAFTPLAAITVTNPTPGVPYPLRPLADGAGGWIVFGPGVQARGGQVETVAVRFSSPAQSLLAPRCARAYKSPPIPTIGKSGRNTALSGFVTIRGSGDVEAVKEEVYVAGKYRDALVLRLKQTPDGPNVLEQYIGPCDARPESKNCPRDGIETINTVRPDCDGNIDISVAQLTAGLLEDCGGLVLSHELDLDEACKTAREKVRGEDLCEAILASSSSSSSSSSSASDSSVLPSSESLPCAAVPYLTDFDDGEADAFTVKSGTFVYAAGDAPQESLDSVGSLTDTAYTAVNGSVRNLAILQACDLLSSKNAVCETALLVTADNPSRNGGLILNYRIADPLTNPHVEFFFVLLDMNVNRIRILRFNGSVLVQEYASPSPLPLTPGYWYKLRVTTSPFGLQTAIAVHLDGLDDPADLEVNFSIATNKYGTTDGQFGVGTDKARTLFSYFKLENGV